MIFRGIVNDQFEAVIRVRLRGPSGAVADITAVVDTGYSGSLTVSDTVVSELRLVRRSGITVRLADGTPVELDTFGAEIEWGGGWQRIVVYAVGDEALVGMRLIAGLRLQIDVAAGGPVDVGPIPP